jgi:hypothetical protein
METNMAIVVDPPTTGKTTPVVSRTTQVDELPAFLTVDELQQFLRIGRSAAYDYARVHGRRVGRLIRVPREVLAGR